MNPRRSMIVSIATLVALALPASGALAFDCFVVNRSNQGAQAVGNSQMWFSASAADGYFFIYTELLGVAPNDPDLSGWIAEALVEHEAAGLPSHIAIFEHHLLMTNRRGHTPGADKHDGDGKGVDHFSESPLGAQMVGIALGVLAS